MNETTLGNRPDPLAPLTRIVDFNADGVFVRVSLRLRQSAPATLTIDAQAFEVDASGAYVSGPDGRPSRTPESTHSVSTSGLGDTHTLSPGWVRKVGTYTAQDFELQAQPESPEAGDEYFDPATDTAYRWDEGETLRIARGKADEMLRIRANSAPLAGISF